VVAQSVENTGAVLPATMRTVLTPSSAVVSVVDMVVDSDAPSLNALNRHNTKVFAPDMVAFAYVKRRDANGLIVVADIVEFTVRTSFARSMDVLRQQSEAECVRYISASLSCRATRRSPRKTSKR